MKGGTFRPVPRLTEIPEEIRANVAGTVGTPNIRRVAVRGSWSERRASSAAARAAS